MAEKNAAAQQEARQRFGRDVRALRKATGVSLKTVSRDICVHLDTLRELETTGLYGHPLLSPVYVRCLVGAYAKAAGLPKENVIAALDEALEGNYTDTLIQSSNAQASNEAIAEQEMPVDDQSTTSDSLH